jgi:hypothetical protein
MKTKGRTFKGGLEAGMLKKTKELVVEIGNVVENKGS